MLIYWLGILTIQTLFGLADPASAEVVYGPSQPQPFVSTPQDKEQAGKIPPKEFVDEAGDATEHALKALPTQSAYTVLPIPAFSYNRNERYWAGGLMPILKANAKGDLEDIWAPEYVYNPYVGHGGSLNYFGYPSDTVQYRMLAWYAEKVDRGIELSYKNLGIGAGRYILAADFSAFKNPFTRFFGFGNNAPETQETNYTSREAVVKLTAGINLNPDLLLMWTERFRDVRVDNGVISSLPGTRELFPVLPGLEGAVILGHGLAARYDTRDSQLVPTRGSYVNVLAEFNQNLQHQEENQWGHVSLDARHYISHADDRMVFVSRVFFDSVFGQRDNQHTIGVPFYEQPTLGGGNTLRAFGRNRYIDSFAVLLNLEERIPLMTKTIFGHSIGIEVAPFLDAGRVGDSNVHVNQLLFKDVQFNPGVGLRLLAKPNVVGRMDVAYGRDGDNFFVGLDYPF